MRLNKIKVVKLVILKDFTIKFPHKPLVSSSHFVLLTLSLDLFCCLYKVQSVDASRASISRLLIKVFRKSGSLKVDWFWRLLKTSEWQGISGYKGQSRCFKHSFKARNLNG